MIIIQYYCIQYYSIVSLVVPCKNGACRRSRPLPCKNAKAGADCEDASCCIAPSTWGARRSVPARPGPGSAARRVDRSGSAGTYVTFLIKIEISELPKAVQRCVLCRSRRELSKAYFLAKFRLDTAENEPSKFARSDAKPATSSGAPVWAAA